MGTRHKSNCSAILKKGRHCTCLSTSHFLEVGEKAHIQEETPLAYRVSPPGEGLVWMERVLAQPCEPDPTKTALIQRGIPSDYLALQNWLMTCPNPRFTNYNRRPKGGDLVFLKKELAEGIRIPWRFFCVFGNNSGFLLIDATLRYEQALNPGWSQIIEIQLLSGETILSHVITIFPLPDKTQSPGWVQGWDTENE
jgi:hypothetical protein